MNSLSDQYFSRVVALARQKKNVKNVKDISEDKIFIEFNNGISEWVEWTELLDLSENK